MPKIDLHVSKVCGFGSDFEPSTDQNWFMDESSSSMPKIDLHIIKVGGLGV
jgi:hypothetical protein